MARPAFPTWLKLLSMAALVALPVAIAISYLPALFPSKPETVTYDPGPRESSGMMNTPFNVSGLRMPPFVKAHEAQFSDDDEVLGVSISGRHRAYRLKSMTSMSAHVINDVLEGTPITVTYCIRNNRVKVFTSNTRGAPLDVDMGGYYNGLLLRLSGRYFDQATNQFTGSDEQALEEFRAGRRTTWGEWRGLYPGTEVVYKVGSWQPPPRPEPKTDMP